MSNLTKVSGWRLRLGQTIMAAIVLSGLAILSGLLFRPDKPDDESTTPAPNGVVKLLPAAAKSLIVEKADDSNFILVDVRTSEEFRSGHLLGAQNLLDFYDPNYAAIFTSLDKSKTYLVYCRTGHRSAQVAEKMAAVGFEKVYDLSGGIQAWSSAGGAISTE